MEAALAVLGAAGFSDSEATEVYASVHTFTLGFAALEVFRARPQQPRRGRQRLPTKGASSWPAYFASLSRWDYPNLTRIQPDLAAFTSSTRFPKAIGRLLASWSPRTKGRAALT
jgi:hypothetical protein